MRHDSRDQRYAGAVPVRLIFECEFCGARPDQETQLNIERQLLHYRHGEYVHVAPARWLIWHGRGLYGNTRYACGKHRGELKASIRNAYGTLGHHPWSMKNQPSVPPDDPAAARRRVRLMGSGAW